jgi:hypothetical protein
MTEWVTIASVVEGHGDVAALPLLIRRVAIECYGCYDVLVPKPHRVPRTQMVRGDFLQRAVTMQSMRITERGGVLVVADADDDCPVELARTLAEFAGSEVVVAVANREFEGWFLAGIESLREHRAVKDDAVYVEDPDAKRAAKEELTRLMHEPYNEPLHQPAFASLVSIEEASRRSRSFRHFVDAVGRLINGSEVSG